MERTRHGRVQVRVLLALVCLVAVLPGRPTTADPEPPDDGLLLADIDADPSGVATVLVGVAAAAWAADDADLAYDAIVELAEEHPDRMVRVPPGLPGADGVLRPAREVAGLLFVRLPEAQRRRGAARWVAETRALLESARRGNLADLERMADRWAHLPAGARALRMLAERDLEQGHPHRAARRLDRWLGIAAHADGATRRGAVLRLTDALAQLGDLAALDRLEARADREGAGRSEDRARRMAATAAVRARRRRPSASPGVALPQDAVVLWTRAFDTAGRLAEPAELMLDEVGAVGAAADGDGLILHEGSIVRRLDALTGRELWRFPATRAGAWGHDPRHRYAPYDLPLRDVTLAGDLALVVLGDPGATGSYEFHGRGVAIGEEPRESRTRLAALDRRTGRLVWTTGLPTDVHPVLGDPTVGCASPPLVDGEAVYAVFARRRGPVELFLARLVLRTGRPTWVSFLASGESGRRQEIAEGAPRFEGRFVQAVPWGARPTIAGDELCVVPHAGFAAGVGADRGAVRWLRPLPRYDARGMMPVSAGFAGRNAPVAHGVTWLIAAMDGPRLVALEQGSGRWLWSRPAIAPDEAPVWRHLLGVGRNPAGAPRLRLVGDLPASLDLDDPLGRVEEGDPFWAGPRMPWGRPLDLGVSLVRAERGLHRFPWAGEASFPDPSAVEIADSRFPPRGDVLRVGASWVVVGRDRIGAIGSLAATAEAVDRQRGQPDLSPADLVATTALAARLRLDADLANEALRLAAGLGEGHGDVIRGALAVAEETLEPHAERLLERADALLDLPADLAAPHLREVVELLDESSRAGELVGRLERWIRLGREAHVTPAMGYHVRADLYAADVLRRLDGHPAAAEALASRRTASARAVEEAFDQPEAALREALRVAAGTPSATRGRRRLLERLTGEGREGEAAAVAADLRLDPDPRSGERLAGRREAAGVLQAYEAVALESAGEGTRARRLANDLLRWAPPGVKTPDGRTTTSLARDLDLRWGWRPVDRTWSTLDAWAGLQRPTASAEIRSVVFPHVVGPGDRVDPEHLLVSRGLGLEVWSGEPSRLESRCPGPGEGWFGGSLREAPPWVPGGGILVGTLVAGEPADRQGLEPGDWIVQWDGQAVGGAAAFMHRVARERHGASVPARILRRGQPLLDRFRPGRRPVGEGAVVRREQAFTDAQGRHLLPGRLDLAWIDPEAGTRKTLWRWEGTGVVNRVRVVFGRAHVVIRRLGETDTLVAVDLETGAECWRRDVGGTIETIEGTGSAVLVFAADPARALVLDSWDGSIRTWVDLLSRAYDERARTLFRARSAVAVHGRLWALTEDGGVVRAVDTTTGRLLWEGETRGLGEHPLIAADGVVALGVQGTLEVLVPDPLTGAPAWRILQSLRERDENPGHPSVFGSDARLFVEGDGIWAVLGSRGSQPTVRVFRLDLKAVGSGTPPGDVSAGSALWERTSRYHWRLGPPPFLVHARSTPEGLFLTGVTVGDRSRRKVAYFAADGKILDWEDPAGLEGGVLQIRRHAPARVGNRLLLPTDQGAQVVRVVPPVTPR